MKNEKYLEKSISELEGWKWTSSIPTSESSFVERTFYKLMNKKLKNYTPEDLRFMIGQDTGLEYFIPMALRILANNLFVETSFYPGSLLENILKVNTEYWLRFPQQKTQLIELFLNGHENIDRLDLTDEIIETINDAFTEFKSK
jgi:hypothetical protein